MSQLQLLADAVVTPDLRREFDYYPTPAWMTRALLRRLPPMRGVDVLEPCSGEGHIERELVAAGARVRTNDFDRSRPADTHHDAGDAENWSLLVGASRRRCPAWTVSNPPFDQANRIVPQAYAHSQIGVAMVLRVSWYEPTIGREDFLEAHPPVAVITMPRHKWRADKDSGDNVTAAWFLWLADEGMRRYGYAFRNDVVTRRERDELSRVA